MPGNCHVCEKAAQWECSKPGCRKCFCSDCLANRCPRIDARLSGSNKKPLYCDCCNGICPKCKPEDSKFVLNLRKRFDKLLREARNTAKAYSEERCKEIEEHLKQQATARNQSSAPEPNIDIDSWQKEVTLPAALPVPSYKFYTSMSLNYRAEEEKVFRYFPFTGDVADKEWVEKDLKPLYPDDEHTREKDLTYEENVVFGNLLTETRAADPNFIPLFEKHIAALLRRTKVDISQWESEHYPLMKDDFNESNEALFCQSKHCLIYCCSVHPENMHSRRPPSEPEEVPRNRDVPCGPQCHLQSSQHSSQDSQSPPSSGSSPSTLKKSAVIIRRLAQQFGKDACLIARLVQRPCSQVHQQLQPLVLRDGEELPRMTESLRKVRRANTHKRALASVQGSNARHYKSCEHSGPCTLENKCPCLERNGACEKWCLCDAGCAIRFPGCQCVKLARSCIRESCICWLADRECDPDLCLTCEASLQNVSQAQRACHNVSMQNGYHKLHGNGLFLGVAVQDNDFLFEYTGERIVEEEAERRGTYYDKVGHSFLFDLAEGVAVDAALKGNRTRFANHSKTTCNVYSRTLWCNDSARIGLFAKGAIEAGEELLLDYQYAKEFERAFVALPDPNKGKKQK